MSQQMLYLIYSHIAKSQICVEVRRCKHNSVLHSDLLNLWGILCRNASASKTRLQGGVSAFTRHFCCTPVYTVCWCCQHGKDTRIPVPHIKLICFTQHISLSSCCDPTKISVLLLRCVRNSIQCACLLYFF